MNVLISLLLESFLIIRLFRSYFLVCFPHLLPSLRYLCLEVLDFWFFSELAILVRSLGWSFKRLLNIGNFKGIVVIWTWLPTLRNMRILYYLYGLHIIPIFLKMIILFFGQIKRENNILLKHLGYKCKLLHDKNSVGIDQISENLIQ